MACPMIQPHHQLRLTMWCPLAELHRKSGWSVRLKCTWAGMALLTQHIAASCGTFRLRWVHAGDQTSFVPLLPPKETTVISSTQALDFQLGYKPVPTAVVAFSEVQPSLPLALCRLRCRERIAWSSF